MKVLWCFDPFAKSHVTSLIGKKIIQNFFDTQDSVQALYVASNAEVELATAYHISEKERYHGYPKRLIKEQLKKIDLKSCKVNVISETSYSLTAIAKNVHEFVKANKIDLLLIATNNQKNLPRFVLGSFAETMIHTSLSDLFVYHQDMKISAHAPKNIFYAHDLSFKGNIGLKRVIQYAKKWKAFLHVFYVPIPDIGKSIEDFKVEVDQLFHFIDKTLKKSQINYKLYSKYEMRPISEILLKGAHELGCDLLVLTAKSSKFAAFLGGSVTRQVLRESEIPLLILKA